MTRFPDLLRLLESNGVAFIVVGGSAAPAGTAGPSIFGLNFTLETSLGLIDLLGEITGGGKYEDLLPHTVQINVFGVSCLCIDLETLIRVKRAAGRPKDFEAIAELESIVDERRKLGGDE